MLMLKNRFSIKKLYEPAGGPHGMAYKLWYVNVKETDVADVNKFHLSAKLEINRHTVEGVKMYRMPHRLDGPAIIYEDGTEEWMQFGQFHRENGPAVTVMRAALKSEWFTYFWYIRDKAMLFDTWIEELENRRGEEHAAIMKMKWINTRNT